MARNIESRIEELEDSMPRGYTTFDSDNKPVIQSSLPGLEWYRWAITLLGSRGHKQEKAFLIAQLERSEGRDNSGGLLYEMVLAMAQPQMKKPDPHVQDRFFKPFGTKVQKFAESSAPRAQVCDHKFVAGICQLCRADIREEST
jgi:hypothetical protein